MLDGAVADLPIRTLSLDIGQRCVAVSIVRVRNPTAVHTQALGKLFEREWPVVPNTAVGTADSVLWMSPGEWAVTVLDPRVVKTRVARACQDALWHVADMSGAYARFEISGTGAQAVMARSCSLDLHPRVFSAGRCAQTVFAQIAALIHQPGAPPRYDVYVDASLAHYLRRWLVDAAQSSE